MIATMSESFATPVVPRKGDVDRNSSVPHLASFGAMSSPARGTWIEIAVPCFLWQLPLSSPARGTWIEISTISTDSGGISVVPRKGDVDRNEMQDTRAHDDAGRPPQGGRG